LEPSHPGGSVAVLGIDVHHPGEYNVPIFHKHEERSYVRLTSILLNTLGIGDGQNSHSVACMVMSMDTSLTHFAEELRQAGKAAEVLIFFKLTKFQPVLWFKY
tara:strand:+ start:2976 stop:3284 length:309 start_codon:yes stop_codon:yes gene_type:complete